MAARKFLLAGEAGWALLRIENIAGSINETYDLLRHTALRIVGEEVLQVDHCLLALPGATVTGFRRFPTHKPWLNAGHF